ncbi:MAG TPA: hypothetical protein VGL38_07295 [bacterium]|jgi:hypothetical protein
MSPLLDTFLVLTAVALALGYLVWRKLRSKRHAQRDWTSGHADVCTSCPVIQIHKARLQKASRNHE